MSRFVCNVSSAFPSVVGILTLSLFFRHPSLMSTGTTSELLHSSHTETNRVKPAIRPTMNGSPWKNDRHSNQK
jgi:hypothetical protein